MRHAATRDPLEAPSPWYILLEISGERAAAGMDHILPQAMERGLVTDGTIAASETQVTALWDIRERLSDVQKLEGGSIKHDVAVPVSLTPQFIDEASRAVAALIPDVRPVPFGHLGDGNIHFNISQPAGADKAAFLARWEEVNAVVHEIVLKLGGTISAEHGIGRMKRDLMPEIKSPVELDMMRMLKNTFDPHGILNPGKLLPEPK
jgi:FAD/FMN-containing dehydrogenase